MYHPQEQHFQGQSRLRRPFQFLFTLEQDAQKIMQVHLRGPAGQPEQVVPLGVGHRGDLRQTVGQLVALHIKLYLAGHILQMGEAGFTHNTSRHHAPGYLDAYGPRFQLGTVLLAVLHVQLCRQGIAPKVIREWHSRFAQGCQLLPSLRYLLLLVRLFGIFFDIFFV